jgi:hypothetical protein
MCCTINNKLLLDTTHFIILSVTKFYSFESNKYGRLIDGLFNDAESILKGRVRWKKIINCENVNILKCVVTACFIVVARHRPGETEENYNISSRITSAQAT